MSACNMQCKDCELNDKGGTLDFGSNLITEFVDVPQAGYMNEQPKTVKDLMPPTIAEMFKTEYSQENMCGNVFFEELGGEVMGYWGRLCGSLFGTITYVNLNKDGTVTIHTNYDEAILKKDGLYYEGWNIIKKETVDKLKLQIK